MGESHTQFEPEHYPVELSSVSTEELVNELIKRKWHSNMLVREHKVYESIAEIERLRDVYKEDYKSRVSINQECPQKWESHGMYMAFQRSINLIVWGKDTPVDEP